MSFRAKQQDLATMGRAAAGIAHGARAYGGPVLAALNLTGRCNIRCIHCYYHSPKIELPSTHEVRLARSRGEVLRSADLLRAEQDRDMDARHAASMIDAFARMGTRRFQISGSGEALLHPEAVPLMERIKTHGGRACLLTNGLLLEGARGTALVDMGVDEIRVTTMAGSSGAYVATHPGSSDATFDKLRRALHGVTEQKSRLGRSRPRLTLVCVVVRHNVDDLLNFAHFAIEVGADKVVFKPVDDVDDPGLVDLHPSPAQHTSLERQLAEAERTLEAAGRRHNLRAFRRILRGLHIDTRQLYRTIYCSYGWISMRVWNDGHVYSCCRCSESLGNVHEESVDQIWFGERFRRFRIAAKAIRERGGVPGCTCHRCVQHATNRRVYRALHPLHGALHRLGGRSAGSV